MWTASNPKMMKALCAGIGMVFIATAIALLHHGHLHEDAYILFQYSHHLSIGQGIVFDRVSGPAEGATDFLWMATLALLSRLGLHLGTAAAVLNGLGLAAISYVTLKIRGQIDGFSLAAVGLVVISGGTAASLGGFSSLAFGGIFALLVQAALNKRHGWMTCLALVLALVRPDGVLLALGSLLVALATALPVERKRILLAICLAAVAGSGYFFWRLHYFGLWLPLPLMVKAQTTKFLEGLGSNYDALARYTPLLLPFLFLLYREKGSMLPWRALLVALAGPTFLFTALMFAHQSQNVGFRFQFPILIGLMFVYLICINEINPIDRMTRGAILLLPFAGMVLGAGIILKEVKYLSNNDYINSFPQYLHESGFKVHTIALTEAGRFPYWFDAEKMTDLVGLNSPQVVIHGAAETLTREQPEFLFVHHANHYDVTGFADRGLFFVAEARALRTRGEYTGRNPIEIAPYAALKYASERDFTAVLVRYGPQDTQYSHVYFLSKKLDINRFMAALQKSLVKKINYDESEDLKKLPAF